MISQPEKTSSSLTLTAKYCIKGVYVCTVSCVSCNRVSVTIYIHYYSETKKVKRADWHKKQNNSVDWLKISKSVVAICNETKITHTEANILVIVQSNK